MASSQIKKLLEFANLQLASEAFLARGENNGIVPNDPDALGRLLQQGNTHASRFMPAQVAQFTDPSTGYTVLDQYRNDALLPGGRGFSGTLFQSRQTGEMTLSFRSVEFIDDTVRDGKGTGEFEIKNIGWALGQIDEMEKWYAQLRATPGLLEDNLFHVTGYSLGGHLATAFNILRHEEAEQLGAAANPILDTYTFNGAGTGDLATGKRLTDVLQTFRNLLSPGASYQWASQDLLDLYAHFLDGSRNSSDLARLEQVLAGARSSGNQQLIRDATLLKDALGRVDKILAERDRLAAPGFQASFFAGRPPAGDQASLQYQVAALVAARDTVPSSTFPFSGGVNNVPTSPIFVDEAKRFANLTEVVGSDGGNIGPSFVSNSGLHWGNREYVYIEDQPLTRGNYALAVDLGGVASNPTVNDFADTHSIVLLVDSLSLMAAFEKLDPTFTIESGRQIYAAASKAKASTLFLTQGEAEGDTLENVLNALGDLLGARKNSSWQELKPSFDGGTWARDDQRGPFHNNLKVLDSAATPYAGLLRVASLTQTSGASLTNLAISGDIDAIAYRYALRSLNPFAVFGPTALYEPHKQNGELDLFESVASTPAGMTAEYVADRAQMLQFLVLGNINDTAAFPSNQVSDQRLYVDLVKRSAAGSAEGKSTELNIFLTGGLSNPRGPNTRVIAFGTEAPEVLQGRDNADRLYGGIGTDFLAGRKSDDYLEGGAGMDVYSYNASTILLNSSNDGNDEVRDTDGRGVIRYTYQDGIFATPKGTVVGGVALKLTPTQWQSPEGKFTYDQQGSDLLVTINGDAGGSIMIRGFDFAKAQSTGYLGIRLVDAPAAATPTREIEGDLELAEFTSVLVPTQGDFGPEIQISPTHFVAYRLTSVDVPAEWLIPHVTGSSEESISSNVDENGITHEFRRYTSFTYAYYLADDLGNALRSDEGQPAFQDFFNDSAQNDHVHTEAGNDIINAFRGGDDVVEGGSGRDVVTAGAGNDWVVGGADGTYLSQAGDPIDGGDLLYGGAGDDVIFGDAATTIPDAIAQGEQGAASTLRGEAINAGAGQDVLVGGSKRDVLFGAGGSDVLVGGAGDDFLNGDTDYVLVETPDPFPYYWDVFSEINGASRTDEYFGFEGSEATDGAADAIYGGAGNDVANAGVGDDYVDLGAGDDWAFGEAGSDILIGGSGNDVLAGDRESLALEQHGDDYLDGGDGADQLFGQGGSDILIGAAGDDTLVGGEGADVLWGGAGTDVLIGGAGKDTYIFNRGDGVEVIVDTPAGTDDPEASVVALGEGISRSQVKFKLGSLLIDLGEGDAIHLDGFNSDDPFATPMLDSIQFADGSSMTYADVLEQGFDLDGTEGDDLIEATAVTDRVDALGGDDIVIGKAGNDSMLGGGGRDSLYGDAGDDVLDGGTEDDNLQGGEGIDVLSGGEGDDLLSGDADADVLDGGSGNDGLGGYTGDDELVGGAGDDSLSGGVGSDTYRYALGDGIDSIFDGGGLSSDSTDTLSFGPGIAHADVSLSRDWDGTLTIRLADGGQVNIGGMYSDPWGRIEHITFDDGTEIGAAELDAVPVGLIVGTEGDDILVGSWNTDTLRAGGGADVLDGDRGSDILEGGVGVDTYRVGLASGQDTIIEAAGETSVIALAQGLALQDLRATRSGDDLSITVRGTNNAVTVQDYFSAAQEISVLDAAGNTASAEQLLEISENEGSTREALKADFRVRAKVNFFARYFVEGEYQFVDANTVARTFANPVFVGVDRLEATDFIDITYFDGRPGQFFVQTQQFVSLRAITPGTILHDAIQFVHQLVESDDPVIDATTEDAVAEVHSEQLVQVDWHEDPDVLLSHTQTFEFETVTDPTAPPGQQAIGIASITHHNYSFSHVARGDFVAAPAGDTPPYLPATELFHRTDVTVTQTLNEVLAGPGDNMIGGAYIADGGAGNDTISGDGLLLGGDGDDTLFGSGALYGEDGNDFISGNGYLDGGHGDDQLVVTGFSDGSVIVTGSGNDIVNGGSGRDVVRVGADDTGSKILWDTGSVVDYAGEASLPFFDAYYDGLGIPNWWNVPDDQLPVVSADDFGLLAQMYDVAFYPTDLVELPTAASLANLDVAWGFVDLYAGPGGVNRTLDLSWGTDAAVRIVLPNASQSTGEEFADLIGNGFERVRLGDGMVLGVDQLVALAPTQMPRRPVQGTEFDDTLYGWQHDDDLEGLAGNDQLQGNGGSDIFHGGPGSDAETGGTGDDRYRYFLGDDIDAVSDDGGADAVVFGEGIAPADVLVTRDPYGTLYLEVGGPQNRLDLHNWFAPENQIERIEFANGTAWDADAIQSRITIAPATGFGDILNGGDGDDVIDGLAGDDLVYGNAGNDILAGGEGNDYLEGNQGSNLLLGGAGDDNLAAGSEPGHHLFVGGAGDDFVTTGAAGDVVAFNAGDGNDSIFPIDAFTLSLGGGIDADDLALSYGDFGLALSAAGGDSIRLLSQPQITLQLFGSVHTYDFSAVIGEFYARLSEEPGLVLALGDVLPVYQTGSSESEALGGAIAWQYGTAGSTGGLTSAQIQSVLADPAFGVRTQPIVLAGETNHAPIAGAISDRSVDEDDSVSFSVADAFSDPDAGDTLAYAAVTVDGDALPEWLSFDPASAAFGGTPRNDDVGSIGIRVTASDGGGLSAFDEFILTVGNVNDAPVVAHAIADRSFAAGAAFTFALPAGTFADEDADDALSLSARLFGGGALPAWLTFNPATGAFNGAPQLSNIGALHLAITATDAAGEAAVADFGLVVRAPDGATVSGRKGDDVIYGGAGNETLVAKGGNDYVFGDAGDDVLRGGAGNDVLQGGEGNDELRSGTGQNLLDGGAGADVLYGGQGSAFLAGGAGNDEIRVGRGTDVIAFNAGDGIDTLYGGRDGGNTLSFGGGIGYDDLTLSKSGHDLVVSAGANDKMVLKNWYRGNQSVENLQVIIDATAEYNPASSDPLYNSRVQVFDMWSLVARFNQALAANPHLDSWSIMNGIADVPRYGSSDAAIGGDLAYWYGKNRALTGIGVAAAQDLLGVPGFGADAQSLRPFSGLQEGFVRLS